MKVFLSCILSLAMILIPSLWSTDGTSVLKLSQPAVTLCNNRKNTDTDDKNYDIYNADLTARLKIEMFVPNIHVGVNVLL